MKKLITIVLLAALALPVFAQSESKEQKWTVRASAAYYPTVPTVALPFIAIGLGLANQNNETEKTDITFPPFCQIEALYSFNPRWSVGLGVGYSGFEMVTKEIATGNVTKRDYFTLMPITAIGRCNYLNRPAVKLYGSLELGAFFTIGGDFEVVPDVQLNPFGVEFGKRFFGLIELGVGLNYFGVNAGVGYRF